MKEISYEPGALADTFYDEVKELCRLVRLIEQPEVRSAVEKAIARCSSPSLGDVPECAVPPGTHAHQLQPATDVVIQGYRDGLTWDEIALFLSRSVEEVEQEYGGLV